MDIQQNVEPMDLILNIKSLIIDSYRKLLYNNL